MGVISNPEMVAAVSEAGGYGLLAMAFTTDPKVFRDEIRATRKITRKPFGANLYMMNPLVQEFAQVLAEEGVEAVTLSGGSPKNLIPFLHERGMKAAVVVPTVEVAKAAEAAGADAIVAEGSESGGVQGFKGASTMVLVPAVADAVEVPVIAAGGIGDSRGYRAALALGAEGVQVGTRFIATRECAAHSNYKSLIVESSITETGLVNMGRFRIRALKTSLVQGLLRGETLPDNLFTPPAMRGAWLDGQLEAGLLPAGEIAGLISDTPSVAEIIGEMTGQTR
jgi:enoyl-[acyl-carrier protein] reductase II